MKTTRLVLLFSAFAFTACDNLSLEGDAARPYACIPHAPADAGKQCADGWSCGFDEKCFKLDAGQAESWRCRFDDECPGGWRCGAEVAAQQFCQQLDVGAPSPCNVLADCQGGWRCGFEHACFDPAIADGGSQRQCTDDAQTQCPLGFRCGERVGSSALCLTLDAGTHAPCNTDHGCEGGFRCDTRAHVCVELTDVVTPGALGNLRPTLLSPLSNAPPPLFFAATSAASSNAFQRVGEPGVVFVSLDDAGVLSSIGQAISGEIAKEQFQLARPVASVKRVGVTTTGPFVVYGDGSRERFTFHQPGPGVAEGVGDFNAFTFEAPGMAAAPVTRMGVVRGASVIVDGVPYGTSANVLAATVWGNEVYAWTVDGALSVMAIGGGATSSFPGPAAVIPPGTQVSVVAGVAGSDLMPPQTRPGFFLVTPTGYQPWLPVMNQWVTSSQLISPCNPMLQLSFSEDGNNPAAIVRCGRPDGGVFSIKQTFEGAMMTTGLIAKSSNVVDDLIPYRGAVVNQTAASTVRAHAGAKGRLWHALPTTMAGVVGERPLRAVVLDRQPDVILWVRAANTSALFASAGSTVFSTVPRNMVALDLGFVSDVVAQNLVPLQTFANRGRWLVASSGIIDVVGSATPSVVAQLPSGTLPLSAPVSAFVTTLGQREVVLLSSRDTIWAADVTGILGDPFAQPGVLEPVLVPAPGVRLRSLTLVPQDAGVGGFVTTSTQTLRFETADLVRWSLSAVESPDAGLPLEVWAQGAQGRVGAADGIIWSLPIMVALTASVRDGAGNALTAGDYARLCGEQFVTTSQGVHRLVPAPDGGLPGWAPLAAVNAALDSLEGLKFYETTSEPDAGLLAHQLYVATPSGQVVEVLGDGPCP